MVKRHGSDSKEVEIHQVSALPEAATVSGTNSNNAIQIKVKIKIKSTKSKAAVAGLWPQTLKEICKQAVDRSQGQLVDITIGEFVDDELLEYVADRSSQLRRLEIVYGYSDTYGCWSEALKKFPLLEELSLYLTEISKEGIETAGRCCPLITTLKLNKESCLNWAGAIDNCPCGRDFDYRKSLKMDREKVIAIGENLHGLRHLELIGNVNMSNNELRVILDGCRYLESLDLRLCGSVDLKGDLGKKCLEKIKCLKLPNACTEECP
ncbi:hypothetical protein L2E82_50359 [Cichorium intybus]|nr:hypothetical protein L2E82_50359 [Cichorium intybus]